MIPCCGSSFCDECKHKQKFKMFKFKIQLFHSILGVRTALLESEDNECPDCNEKGSSPGSLIPNRFLRNSVNSFKNETGYIKPPQEKSEFVENDFFHYPRINIRISDICKCAEYAPKPMYCF